MKESTAETDSGKRLQYKNKKICFQEESCGLSTTDEPSEEEGLNPEEANDWRRETRRNEQMTSYARKMMNVQLKSFYQVTKGSQMKVDLDSWNEFKMMLK